MASEPVADLRLEEDPSRAGNPRLEDIQIKQHRVAEFLEDEGFDGLLLARYDNFAWFTSGGDNSLGVPNSFGEVALFLTREHRCVLATNVDSARVFDEELSGLGFQLKERPWHEPREQLWADVARGRQVAADISIGEATNAAEKVRRLRIVLTQLELERYRRLGRDMVHAAEATCRGFQAGETEAEVAAQLTHRLMRHGIAPVQLLVAADDRSSQYRQAIFKQTPIQRRAVVTVCGRRDGLCASLSRTVCFGKVEEEFASQHNLANMIDGTYIMFSRPGEQLGEVLRRGLRIYEKFNEPHEWMLCQQGSITGYAPSEIAVLPGSTVRLGQNMALAWHPTVGPTRSQDTVLIDSQGFEIVTAPQKWPVTTVSVKGVSIDRPGILVR